jgi:hypothetical protein
MTRLSNYQKGGYYPFPDEHLPAVASLFAPASEGRLLDPCAGEGRALAHLAQAWGLTPYANELDKARAALCVEQFGSAQAVEGDLFRLRASHDAFSLLWLNPLYGEDVAGDEKRNEFAALKHALKWVQGGGYLCWVVYQQHSASTTPR